MYTPCITKRQTYSKQHGQFDPCRKFGCSIAGPDGCEGCQNVRKEFQKLWDSPAREGKPGEKWYYDDRHLLTSDWPEYHRGYGWCIEGKPETYVFPYTERQFQELVEKGKTRESIKSSFIQTGNGFLHTVGGMIRVHGSGSLTYTEVNGDARVRGIRPTSIYDRRPTLGGCGEKCNRIILMISKASRINRDIHKHYKTLLKRETSFLRRAGLKCFSEEKVRRYMRLLPHDEDMFECKCPFHTQFRMRMKTFAVPGKQLTYCEPC